MCVRLHPPRPSAALTLTEAELRLSDGRLAEAEAERVGPAHQILEGAAAEAPAWGDRDAVLAMLAPLYWLRCTGYAVLAPLYWLRCTCYAILATRYSLRHNHSAILATPARGDSVIPRVHREDVSDQGGG